MTRGIYLVANLRSQDHCENLVHSIRRSGCTLPIRLIPYGGAPVESRTLLREVEVTPEESYSQEGRDLVARLTGALSCPRGFMLRYLAFFGDWEVFCYSDNDIVALMNWDELFQHFDREPTLDLLHADEEYTTGGRYNYHQPQAVLDAFGQDAMASAITAGHFLLRRDHRLLSDIDAALKWMADHPGVTIPHDQTLLHLAALIGHWRINNLCRGLERWGSSWAGDYPDPLTVIHTLSSGRRISHIHYSGGWPDGSRPLDVLLDSFRDRDAWNRHAALNSARHTLGINQLRGVVRKVRRRLGRK
ncbi:MAG TPA: hypothetical protein VHX44_14465 [Planctomycetota bacterium]|nr:hypothetical protein [Planctomycetota bacterium]